MLQIQIDGKQIEVQQGATVMEAAHELGTYIPHFCYHKKLSIAANCRMCLVEVEHAFGQSQAGSGRRDGVPAHQPPTGLPRV